MFEKDDQNYFTELVHRSQLTSLAIHTALTVNVESHATHTLLSLSLTLSDVIPPLLYCTQPNFLGRTSESIESELASRLLKLHTAAHADHIVTERVLRGGSGSHHPLFFKHYHRLLLLTYFFRPKEQSR